MWALTVAWASLFLGQAEVRRLLAAEEREREKREEKERGKGGPDSYTEASDEAGR